MLTLHTLTPHFGAEIIGLNLSHALSARTTDAVSRVLDTHGIVLVQHQQFTAETFLAFSRALGELAVLPQPNVSHPRHAELTLLSNIIENGAPIGLAESGSQWRMDGAHLKTPYRATLHYAVEIPQKAGVPLGDT